MPVVWISVADSRWRDLYHLCFFSFWSHQQIIWPPQHFSLTQSELKVSLFPFCQFSVMGVVLCLNHFSPLTDRSNVRTVNTVRGSVIGCTENLLLGSLWTYQSSLTYVFKAALLAACSSCHGNPNAISPHCLDRSISRKLFSVQSPGLLKLGRRSMRACLVQFLVGT